MASIKLLKFLGEAPRITTELLPDGAAQTAYNTKLYSGDLIPYRKPVFDRNIGRTGTIKTVYPLTSPTGTINWLAWNTSVDIVKASLGDAFEDDEQRFYYTGDGPPKVSTYDLATSGAGPYPANNGFYQLGLPLPTVKPTTSVTAFNALTSVSFARDSANQATVVTNGPHGIKTGNIITIRDFTGTTPETFNSTNVTATVLSDTSVQYFNTGDNTSVTADTNGKVDLAGTTQARNYIYSWITPWDEESIPSDPSETDFIKEGQVVTLNNLPTASPTIPAQNFIRGLRLYRTIPTASGTAYYKLTDAWYPVSVATVARSTNVATVEFADYHNLAQGDRFKISGCTDSSFNITDGEVLSVTGNKTITYTNAGADKATTADTSCLLYTSPSPRD